ncbi:MAG: prolipoprotein diacylglyceryl transferase [Sphingobacteriia bacterium]|nr:prolipoprotein diacylglyceryl transferase [Sphingobacteriia bacterium]
MTTVFFHNINPILFNIGPLSVTYYGIAYALGALIGLWYIKKLNIKLHLATEKDLDDLLVYAILGIIIGGRLGYVLVYKPMEYFSEPIKIMKTWEGGMSFHGGLIGVVVAMYLYCRKYKIKLLSLSDIVAPAVPIGLFLGRIANFINGELYGKVTNGAWGVVFPDGGNIPRHPSQLYQAFFEGVILFSVLNYLFLKTKLYEKRGFVSGTFLAMYGFFRVIMEVFREPDEHIGYIISHFTMGQLLSMPMIAIGMFIMTRALRNEFGINTPTPGL